MKRLIPKASEFTRAISSALSEIAGLHAVIFDLDGVIADSEPNHFEAFNQALAPYGFHLDFEYFKHRMIGISPRESLTRVRDDFGLLFNVAAVAESKDRSYQTIAAKNPRANTLVIDLVHRLKKHFTIALASGSPLRNVKVAVKSLSLSEVFDTVVSGDEVRHGKPDPEIFLLAAKRLSISPQYCVVFEDSVPGIEAAHRAGMHAIAIQSEYTSKADLQSADLVIGSAKTLQVENVAKLLLGKRVAKGE